MDTSDFAASHMTVNGFMPAAKPSTPEQQALYNKKAKALGLSTDISESQWIQSAMGYNRDTTAFGNAPLKYPM